MSPRRILRRLGAVFTLVGILAGVPALLLATTGSPSLDRLPDLVWLRQGLAARYFQPGPLLHLLTLVTWVAWAYTALVTILRGLTAVALALRLAGGGSLLGVSNLLALRPVRALIDAAIGVTLLAATAASPQRDPTPDRPPAVITTVRPQAPSPSTQHHGPLAIDWSATGQVHHNTAAIPPTTSPDGSRGEVHLVRPGESLWSIARDQLDDPYRWQAIFELNQGRRMPDGEVVQHPGLIQPGWPLKLPTASRSPRPPAPPPATPDRPQPAPSSTVPREPSPSPTPEDSPAESPRFSIQLPSGSVIGASFAAGMLTQFLLARLRTRRRYRPGASTSDGSPHDPDLPDTMRQLLQRLRPDPPEPDLQEEAPPPALAPQQPDQPDPAALTTPAPTTPPEAIPASGLRVTIGEHAGSPVCLDLAEHPTVSVTGPDGPAVARVLITTLLADNHPHTVEVLITGQPVWSDGQDFPGLQHTDLDDALTRLETDLLRRARLLEAADAPDLATYRSDPNNEPLPILLLVVDPEAVGQQPQRLHALLEQGAGLGVAALAVGTALPQPGAVLHVDPGGQPTAVTPATLIDQPEGTQLYRLTEQEAADLLGVLARARRDDLEDPDQPIPPPARQQAEDDEAGDEVFLQNIPPPDLEPVAFPQPAEPSTPGAVPIQVQLLGTYRLLLHGKPVTKGLRGKPGELLAFYLLHPQGAPLDTAIDALWPEAPPVRGHQRLWSVLGNLRTTIRRGLGNQSVDLLIREGTHYRFQPDLIDADVWRFHTALANARHSDDPDTEAAALQAAAEVYQGDLLPDSMAAWVHGFREDLRRRALDALTRLAELHQHTGEVSAAITALDQAIQLSPTTEELYRRLMRLQAPDRAALHQTYQRLQSALTDLDADPDAETEHLLAELLPASGAVPSSRQSSTRPQDRRQKPGPVT